LQCVAVCCSVLQCVAVCCSVLQCVAVCCSVLQCAAVYCSVLQCVAVCCIIRRQLLYNHIITWRTPKINVTSFSTYTTYTVSSSVSNSVLTHSPICVRILSSAVFTFDFSRQWHYHTLTNSRGMLRGTHTSTRSVFFDTGMGWLRLVGSIKL